MDPRIKEILEYIACHDIDEDYINPMAEELLKEHRAAATVTDEEKPIRLFTDEGVYTDTGFNLDIVIKGTIREAIKMALADKIDQVDIRDLQNVIQQAAMDEGLTLVLSRTMGWDKE